MSTKLGRSLCVLVVVLWGVHAQQSSVPEVINWTFPLERAADRMEQIYARPVTYEDPLRVWRGEMEPRGRLPNGSDFLVVKAHTFRLPEWPGADKVPVLDLGTVAGVVGEYERQNPEQPAYRVLQSAAGFHIVPTEARDANGRRVPAVNVLDSVVSVPVEPRTASEHLAALCLAITSVSGIPTDFWKSSVDQLFAANGYLLPRALTGAERPYMVFQWGTTEKMAREALIDLLAGSATTLSWRLHCGPDFRRNENGCALSLRPLQVGPSRVVVTFDRCTRCKQAPQQ